MCFIWVKGRLLSRLYRRHVSRALEDSLLSSAPVEQQANTYLVGWVLNVHEQET